MNFLCHAIPYLDEPVVAAASGIPDWLSVVDRKIRARAKLASPYLDSDDPFMADVARGILAHIDDDRWFHSTEAFTKTNLEFAVELRDRLPGDQGFRPTFVGHILIEMLLDRFYLETHAELGEAYYDLLQELDLHRLQHCVNVITSKPTDRLVSTVERFIDARFLYDYSAPDRLLSRLNQVMRRVRLEPLPETLLDWLPIAEQRVGQRRVMMLTPPGSQSVYPE